ncbi:hypothetical protein LXL04_029245 [Taraxacum kok-saghyz]
MISKSPIFTGFRNSMDLPPRFPHSVFLFEISLIRRRSRSDSSGRFLLSDFGISERGNQRIIFLS